jgi:hypothetical protein
MSWGHCGQCPVSSLMEFAEPAYAVRTGPILCSVQPAPRLIGHSPFAIEQEADEVVQSLTGIQVEWLLVICY